MRLIDAIKDNSLLIIPKNNKHNVVKEITKLEGIYNIKYSSFEEIEDRLYSYNENAIHYLMDKYNYKYDVACVYLDNIRYIEEKKYNNNKLDFLVKLRSELLDLGFIKYGLIEDYQYDNIIIYGYDYINNYRKKIVNELESKYNVIYVNDNILDKENKIYEFVSIKDEIINVAGRIIDLINLNIDINNIKIVVSDSSYNKLINNIFSLFGLKTNIKNKTSLDVTVIGKFFLDNIDDDINITLDKIKDNFDMEDKYNIIIYNKIINVLNKYDNSHIRSFIKDIFKNTYLDTIRYSNEIEVLNIYNNVFSDEDYVFILGFNQGLIPKINKDEEFFNDKELKILGLETSIERNNKEKEALIKKIKSINNLYISYKLYDNNGEYLISLLNDELGYEVIKNNTNSYLYSNNYNKLKLGILLDNLVKYGIHDDILDKLYSTYSDINYLDYDNSYKEIDKDKLKSFLDNKLVLSYSSLSSYYECSFKYYLSYILKIVPYEKTFKSLIGDVFHYILSICFDNEIDIDKEYDKYLEDIDFEMGEKEKFFFNKLKEDLKFIIDGIKEQYKHNSLDKTYYEKKVMINNNIDDYEVTFMGFIDKIMYKKYNDKDIVSIIDYKTGNPDISINNIVYGLDMQLPIYLYLVNHCDDFNNPIIVGFYLQKILNSVPNKDYVHNYLDLKRDNLKLVGYSTSNKELLEEFDDSYSKSSVIKSMSTTKSGEFSSYAKVLNEDEINKLVDIVEDRVDNATKNIIDTKFDINPKVINGENKACKYCMFYDICYVNPKNYVKLKEVKDIFKED